MTERSENNLTEILDAVAHGEYNRQVVAAASHPGSEETAFPDWENLPLNKKNTLKSAMLPLVMDVLSIVDAEPHKAKRGDEVEAWIKGRRDKHFGSSDEWVVLNDLLDDYRAHADYGTPLSEEVEEPPNDPHAGASEVFGPPDIKAMIEGKEMREYDYNSSEYPADLFPDHYENQEHQHDLYTATVWALHLNIPAEAKDAVLERVSKLPEATGEYTYGDSFVEWGEPSKGPDDMHMTIYFKAEAREAYRIGSHIANHAHVVVTRAVEFPGLTDVTFAISTSGDYAAQLQEPK